jgi:long-chain acyl-CoA synthetase
VTTPDHIKIGTVGPPLPGTALSIAPDGEVLVRGPHVFAGYWRNDRATAEVMDDGWFRTGDLGELDDEGYLRITGRKKDIIVTAGGKNVAPAALEDQLRAHPLVSQCVVVGDQRPYIGCLVTLDADMLPTWLANRGRPELTPAEAVDDPEVNAEIARAVEQANATVSRAESIRRFRILPIDFTEDSGHLTPSIKLKRSAVLKDFSAEVEALYS